METTEAMDRTCPTLYMVIPCYNEEAALPYAFAALKAKLSQLQEQGRISPKSRILLVDDGSTDKTWAMIREAHAKDSLFTGIKFAHNRGHQYAVLAGLMAAKDRCDCTISMDADLQDDIQAIDHMLVDYQAGSDVVYGVRTSRETDTSFKRTTAESYYKLLNKMGAEVIYNHADFRLLSQRALEALAAYQERNIYLRGLVPQIGYSSSQVGYERKERVAGESKYPLRKMVDLAIEGITSLTTRPLRWITELGLGISLASLIVLIVSIVKAARKTAPLGWPSLIASIWILGGILIFAVGLVGEYVGKTYMESKQRPRWLIEESLFDEE